MTRRRRHAPREWTRGALLSIVAVLAVGTRPVLAGDGARSPAAVPLERSVASALDEEAPPRADDEEAADAIPPWDAGVPIFSAAGCLTGAALAPVVPLGLALPAASYVVENPELLPLPDPACGSVATVAACAGVAVALIAPCSALGATLGAVTAAWSSGRSPWRPLLGGLPGVLCAVLSPLSCLCFALPFGSVFTVIGLALGSLGGPIAFAGATVVDAQVAERTFAFFGRLFANDDDANDDGANDDVMHY